MGCHWWGNCGIYYPRSSMTRSRPEAIKWVLVKPWSIYGVISDSSIYANPFTAICSPFLTEIGAASMVCISDPVECAYTFDVSMDGSAHYVENKQKLFAAREKLFVFDQNHFRPVSAYMLHCEDIFREKSSNWPKGCSFWMGKNPLELRMWIIEFMNVSFACIRRLFACEAIKRKNGGFRSKKTECRRQLGA